MAQDIHAAFIRSRASLISDAVGVLALALLLIGGLQFSAVF
jgi:hypothetical protein